jgi:hypothetical protein
MIDLQLLKLIYRNSEIIRKENIKFKTFFNQKGGSTKNLTVNYKNNRYTFEESEIDKNYYILFSKNGDECINIIISEITNTAEIIGIKAYEDCLCDSNKNIGSILLKITMKLVKKYKDKYDIKTIILKDNSIKKCNNNNIKLPIMLILLTGDTWYGKYNFRPYIYNNYKYHLDKFNNKLYEKNKKKILSLKITDINLLKYISKTKNVKLIEATEKTILNNPSLLLIDFLSKILNKFNGYDKTCNDFIKFYEKLYYDISLFDPIGKLYGIEI